MKLPNADWQERRGLPELLAALDGRARYVGGAVRDSLLGVDVKDVDIATPLLPDDVMARLKAVDITVVPTGIDHGTLTAVLPDGPIEITTLRRDVSTDGRRATVAFSDDWREDAARRDFTINALFADPDTLEIYDYFDGLNDLEARRIRFIGSADERIAEDHLRILRYFRFLARFGLTSMDQEAYQACRSAAEKLPQLSRERIADELMKLLAVNDPSYAVQQMIGADIFAHILSEIDPDTEQILARLIQREQAHAIPPIATRRLIALLPKNTEKVATIAKDLRFSKKLQKALQSRLAAPTDELAAVNATSVPALAYHHGEEATRDIALLFAADTDLAASLATLEGWQKPEFPLKGGDLISMGMEPGPAVSETLAKIEQAWIKQGFPNEEHVYNLAKQALDRDKITRRI